ncbi:MAG: archease [Candidatus Aenigmatarchaeota archaeon]
MEKFEFVDITTADVAFYAYGKTLDNLFSNAALAMFEVMINTGQIKPKITKNLKVKGNDLESLMFNWLNALLVYVDGSSLAFSKFNVKVDGKKFSMVAECIGEKIDSKRHETRTEVKAATYHKLEINKEDDYWKARVIIDI